MPKSRPSAQAFRNAGWLPSSHKVYEEWREDLRKRVILPVTAKGPVLIPSIQEFKDFIETDATVYTEFIRMYEGATEAANHTELCLMLNDIFRKPPFYGDLGPPMYMIMARSMDTQGGFSAYTKENLNRHFKKLFETWATYLESKDSRYVLVDTQFDEKHYGWFYPTAKAAMMAQYDKGRLFEQVFICDPQAQYYGYTSYEDFFNRRFRSPEIDRPVGDGGVAGISAACEAVLYDYQEDVQRSDQLFIKDEAYSLVHLLYNDSLVDEFVGGIVVQGFLNTTGYHRWHAPVDGTIRKIVDVPGTYFAQAPSTIGTAPTAVYDAAEPPPYLQSLTYFANTAARQIMFIDADDATIGLMCFISIGMTEISTCQATVYTGQHVNRGDELGMFHFGGSSFALVFRKDTVVIREEFKVPHKDVPLKINETIGVSKSLVKN